MSFLLVLWETEWSSTVCLLRDNPDFIDFHCVLLQSSVFQESALWFNCSLDGNSPISLVIFVSLFWTLPKSILSFLTWADQKSKQQSNHIYIIDLFRDAKIFSRSFSISSILYFVPQIPLHAIFACDCYQILIQCFYVISAFGFPFCLSLSCLRYVP